MTSPSIPRLSTGIPGLDAMIGGGFLPGDATLVAGSPGTGKTTLGLHFLAAGVAVGEPTVFVTFEYLPQQIYRDAEAKGWSLRAWEEKEKCLVLCTTPEVLLAHGETTPSLLESEIERIGAKRVVIDSVAHFEMHAANQAQLRIQLSGILNRLRLLGVTPLLTHELPQIVGPSVTISTWGLEFLVDNVILLRFVEIEGKIDKAISVLKFRGGDHDRKFRLIRMTDKGIVVEAGFQNVENITTGSGRRTLQRRAEELI